MISDIIQKSGCTSYQQWGFHLLLHCVSLSYLNLNTHLNCHSRVCYILIVTMLVLLYSFTAYKGSQFY